MAAYNKNTPGMPTSGNWSLGDTVTDSNGTVYICVIAGFATTVVGGPMQWAINPSPLDQMGGALLYTVKNAITAHAGGTQAGALADAASFSNADVQRFTVVATIGDSTVLPASTPGRDITITNAAANSMNVFPNTGDAINGAAANALYALAGGKTAEFTCAVAGQWHAILSA